MPTDESLLGARKALVPQRDFEVRGATKRYLYSFSGADARVFTYFPSAPELIKPLDTVHTISVSVHEAKGQARALGHRGIKGLARGVRTIAGSLILTVINDHPLRSLMNQYREGITSRRVANDPGWSLDRDLIGVGTMLNSYDLNTRMPTLLPPFDLAIQYVSEMSPFDREDAFMSEFLDVPLNPDGAGVLIRGIEFIDDGFVTSTNDIVSEMTFSFIAFDYKPMARFGGPQDFQSPQMDDMEESARELRNRLFEDGFRRELQQDGVDPDNIEKIIAANRVG